MLLEPASVAARAQVLAARVRTLLDDAARAAGPQTWTGPAASELSVELSARRAHLAVAADDLTAHAAALAARPHGARR